MLLSLVSVALQVALGSEGRPVHADIHLWLGPNYTPFSIKAGLGSETPSGTAIWTAYPQTVKTNR